MRAVLYSSMVPLGCWLALAACIAETSGHLRQDASHPPEEAGVIDSSQPDAGVCPLTPVEPFSCVPPGPKGSDASVDPGDASCLHPEVVEECTLGWCRIPAGCFVSGSPPTEPCSGPIEEQVQVFITRPFQIWHTETTQEQWSDMGFLNPGEPAGCPDCPINHVNIFEAFAFANAMSEREGLEPCYDLSCCVGTIGTGCPPPCLNCSPYEYQCPEDVHRFERQSECPGYRLPTGPEWEYAARAGTTTATYNGDIEGGTRCESHPVVDPIAWHCGNAWKQLPMPVGQKQPNGWGLHDMLGNLEEMVDFRYNGHSLEYNEGRPGPLVDPVGPGPGEAWGFESRGASYLLPPCFCRSSKRVGGTLHVSPFDGFRVVRTLFE